MMRIKAPVYGFYAGNDARIDASIPDTTAQMRAAGKTYDPVTYDGAGTASCAPAKPPMQKMRQEGPRRRLGPLEEFTRQIESRQIGVE